MNEKLLDKVSIEKIDELFSSLSEVIKSMRSVQENSEECFQDETFWACYTLRDMLFTSLRQRERTGSKG
nr:MAG TPA: hypothetical protein [Caudoviricetes sp.]